MPNNDNTNIGKDLVIHTPSFTIRFGEKRPEIVCDSDTTFSLKGARCAGAIPECMRHLMQQSGNQFVQCIPTNDAPERTWYYDINNLLLHSSITNPIMNQKCIDFQTVVNYALNDQLNSGNNEIAHIAFDSKHQHCRRDNYHKYI